MQIHSLETERNSRSKKKYRALYGELTLVSCFKQPTAKTNSDQT